MQESVILTKEEYNELVRKANEPKDDFVNIHVNEYQYLKACENSLNFFTNPTRICPKCHKAMLVEGYICPVCGHDDSV